MLQTPVTSDARADETQIALFSAGTAPGPELARRAAASGAEVMAMDADPAALARLVGLPPAQDEGCPRGGGRGAGGGCAMGGACGCAGAAAMPGRGAWWNACKPLNCRHSGFWWWIPGSPFQPLEFSATGN